MEASEAAPTQRALVLAAGNGDRFCNGSHHSKLLQPVLGTPLILRTLSTAIAAGITCFDIVLGYQADLVRSVIAAHMRGVTAHFSFNADWHLENGVSVLAAREPLASGTFALLMGDHVVEAASLSRLLKTPVPAGGALLAIDRRSAPAHVANEATKVVLEGSRIVAIGKDLQHYDALDTGMFVCTPSLFDALDESLRRGDTTLSGGVRRLAARGVVRGMDIGDAEWYDIDTLADLEEAETRLASHESG